MVRKTVALLLIYCTVVIGTGYPLPAVLADVSLPVASATVLQTNAALHSFDISESFGSDAAGMECTLRIYQPGSVSDEAILGKDILLLDQQEADDAGQVRFTAKIRGIGGNYPYVVRCENGDRIEGSLYVADGLTRDQEEAYYLLDEDFNMLKANSQDNLEFWGWDILEDGGTIDYSFDEFLLKDTDNTSRLTIRRDFARQSNTKLELEFRFSQNTLQDDTCWELRDGGEPVLQLYTAGGVLYAGDKRMTDYQANTLYGIRVSVNLQNQQFSVYINGTLCAEHVSFVAPVSAVDNLVVSTGSAATGSTNFKPVRLSRGYLLAERWIAYTPGSLEEGFWQADDSGGTVEIRRMASVTPPDVYSVVLDDTSAQADTRLSKRLPVVTDDLEWQFKFLAPAGMRCFTAALSEYCVIQVRENVAYIKTVGGGEQKISDIIPNLWYTVQVNFYPQTGLADISLNGKTPIENINVCTAGASVSELSFMTGESEKDCVWVDDILLKRKLPLPEDYVPPPQIPEKTADEPLVGIQTCDLWHEGKHFGWDKINRDPYRKPYLGYYDDGSSEVKDWEIKYMAEHGIDFSIHCWYRPSGGTGYPIKEPRNGFSLHDGLFNAEYRHAMKFAIAWENGSGSSTNEEDFRKNIVPFWMEYYFKDSDYLVLDNKPVVGIYNINGLIASFGQENIKAQLDYLRQACIEAGFSGAYILGVTGSSDKGILQVFQNYGFDAIYCYSWGTSGYGAEDQKNAMLAQRNAEVIPIIATLAMGRDDTPWNRNGGGFLRPKELQELAQWVKESYLPECNSDTLDGRMVMLDNWNEYGEGHFFMPAELAGFDYLEAIGAVFGQTEHTDIRPSAQQLERLGRLYPQDRTVEQLPYQNDEAVYQKAIKTWDFDSGDEGFTTKSWHVTNLKAEDGALTGIATSDDPILYSPNNLEIALENVSYLRIRYKNGSSSTTSKLYFITEEDQTWNESKAVSWAVPANMEGYADFLVPVGKNKNWTGTLKQLRLDPFEGQQQQTFWYDTVEILKDIPNAEENLISNGNMEGEGLPQTVGASCSFTGWDYHGGYRSLMTVSEGANAEIVYPVGLTSGKYVFECYARGKEDNVQIDAVLRFTKNGDQEEVALTSSVPANEAWEHLSSEIILPDGAYTDSELVFKIQTPESTVFLDGILLCHLSPLQILEQGFLDEAGLELNSAADTDDSVIFKAVVINREDDPVTLFPWLASYQNGRQTQIDTMPAVTIAGGEEAEIELQLSAQEDTYYQQGLWDSEMRPMSKVRVLK